MRSTWAAFVLVALAATASADDLATARKAVEDSDYLAARTALAAAIDGGDASPSDLAEIYKLSGIVEGALDDAAAATSAFEKWLVLDPKGSLPAGTSPKIRRPFDAATAKLKGKDPLKVKTETSANPPSVTVLIANDPTKLIARARVHVRADGGAETVVEGQGKSKIKLKLPHGKRLDLRVEALDAHGNRVVELGSTDVPIVITGAGEKPDDGNKDDGKKDDGKKDDGRKPIEAPDTGRPAYLSYYVWGGATIVFAGIGGYFGYATTADTSRLRELNNNSQQHTFDEARAAEDDAHRDALLFDIGMGVAGALAIGTVVLYLTAPEEATEHRVGVIPTHDGAAVTFGGTF